jgi:hypothetical protein
MVLACASTLAAKCGGNPERIMAGMVNIPVVATLPGPEPDREPIYELPMIETKPAPPLRRPKIERIMAIQSSITLVLDNRCAEITNTKMMYMVGSLSASQIYNPMFAQVFVTATSAINDASIHS